MVFLRPTVIRNASASTALATDRYDYMRTQIISSQPGDSPIFRDFDVAPPPSAPARVNPAPAPQGSAPATSPSSAAPVTGAFAASASTKPGVRAQLVQVVAFSDVARARQLVRELRDAGYDAYWESVTAEKGEAVRVRIAVDAARQEVGQVVASLKARGHDPVLVVQ
jgi:cell division septation protein DedD